MRRLIVSFVALLAASSPAQGASQAELLAGDHERIMEIDLATGGTLHNGVVAYQLGEQWLIPLIEFSQALELFIQPQPKLAGAKGFINQEDQTFELNLSACEASLRGEPKHYPCTDALAFEQDIYVDSTLLSAWLPVALQIEPLKSRILVSPREKLPVQARMERENRGKGSVLSSEQPDPGFPRKSTESELFNGPTLDQQVGFSHLGSPRSQQSVQSYNTAVSGRTLGLDTYANLSGTSQGLGPFRLTFSKKDPDRRLGGVLHASQFQALDIDMPALPLVAINSQKKGLFLSSEPLGQTSTFSTQDFQGILLPNWQVELYQNEVLIDLRSYDGTGRYLFKGIPLLYGMNQFRLAFYGPFGRRRDEYYTYQIGSNLQKQGQQTYRVALATDQSEPIYTFQTDRGISDRLTLAAGSSRLYLRQIQEKNTYLWLGLSGYADSIFLNASSALASNDGRAYEAQARLPWRGVTTGLRLTKLDRFRSELYNFVPSNLEKTFETAVDTNFVIPSKPALTTILRFTKSDFGPSYSEKALGLRIASSLGPLYLNHDANYVFQAPRAPYSGKFDAIYVKGGDRYRASLSYDNQSLATGETEYFFQLGNSHSIGARITRFFGQDLWQLGSSFGKTFKFFALQSNASYSTNREFSVGANLTMSFTRDSNQNRVRISPESQVSLGAVAANLYIDQNRNGLRDPEEQGLAEAVLINSQRSDETLTDAQGQAYIPRLQTYQPTDVSISAKSLKDPLVKSSVPGYRVFPRPGQVTSLDFPVIYTGMIDGMVQYSRQGALRPARSITVELVDLIDPSKNPTIRTKTDSDGFYGFEGVPPGQYRLRLLSTDSSLPLEASTPPDRTLQVPPRGALLSGQDFLLRSP